MGGMYTDRRQQPVELASTAYTATGAYLGRFSQVIPCYQETTSYRSGPRVPPESFEEQIRRESRIYGSPRELRSSHDTGHEFNTIKTSVQYASKFDAVRCQTRSGVDVVLKGHLGPFNWYPVSQPVPINKLSSSDIQLYGGRAIKSTAPTAPSASLATMLGELVRDGTPAVFGANLLDHPGSRGIASEFLNYEFGWKPLLNDLDKLLRSVVRSSQILQQFRRDSGKIVRRKFHFPVEISYSDLPPESGYGKIWDGGGDPWGRASQVLCHTRTERRMWFSGAYTYYLDVGDELIDKAMRFEQLANKLLGIRITPDVLWELTPWSWLADWGSTVGTSLSNVSMLQSDGLVIRWGYLMCHTVTTRTLTGDLSFPYGKRSPLYLKTVFRSERKERFRSTPYGFGLSLTGLTSRQWAILAALGMTRAPRIAF